MHGPQKEHFSCSPLDVEKPNTIRLCHNAILPIYDWLSTYSLTVSRALCMKRSMVAIAASAHALATAKPAP